MLLPITFVMSPIPALIMMAGIYYGTQYGGSTTSILINMPGEASSIVTALDGYQMARQGRAGAALATAAIGSFFAGTVSTVLIAMLAPPLTEFALNFGSPEYFALMVLGLVASISLAQGSIVKALAMLVLGVCSAPSVRTWTPAPNVSRSAFPILPTGWNSSRSPWACSDYAKSLRNLEDETHADHRDAKGRRPDADPRRFRRMARRSCAARRSARSLACCPAAGRSWHPSPAYWIEKTDFDDAAGIRDAARSRASPSPEVGQQRRRADLVHPDAHARHSRDAGDGADDRRDDRPGHHPRPECHH